MLGICHGCDPLAIKPSVSRITGVIRSSAIRLAWNAISKQSLGLLAATTTSGHSPLRP